VSPNPGRTHRYKAQRGLPDMSSKKRTLAEEINKPSLREPSNKKFLIQLNSLYFLKHRYVIGDVFGYKVKEAD
jgi:hypothetical protein